MILRPANARDAPAIASLLRTTRQTSLSFLPNLHSPAEELVFVANNILPEGDVWIAEHKSAMGFIAFRDGWIDHLYVHPLSQGQGVGRALLAKALEDGARRQLWTFQANARARRFYESHGFKPVEFTDGAGNEENTPDVRYVWRGEGL